MTFTSAEKVLKVSCVAEACSRGLLTIKDGRVRYGVATAVSRSWKNPEEWVRAHLVAWLVVERGYPANRIRIEVSVPHRTPKERADVVVYRDDDRKEPYLVGEAKAAGRSQREYDQAVEQAIGYANVLRAGFALVDEGRKSAVFDVAGYPAGERDENRLGARDTLPKQYGDAPEYKLVAGHEDADIRPIPAGELEARIRRAHSLIWAGGRRDPLVAFDEWSKLLFAKVHDERMTPTGKAREFQFGKGETTATVANRIRSLFSRACKEDPSIFPGDIRLELPDTKIADVTRVLETAGFTRTDVDSIGKAFEQFFGAIFRGGLGQYFTRRQIARFVVAMVEMGPSDYVLDPTAGSGGFLLEALLQVWHQIDRNYHGQDVERLKRDFAANHVYGIEIHEVLGRICKINLLLHHDGHTNIESDRTCLDTTFTNKRLNPPMERFTRIVGNPPFGTTVSPRDEDKLGANTLNNFTVARGGAVASEQIILERSIALLEPGGRLGLVLPDGLLNNPGERSNCPATRELIATTGRILAIVSLPDYAFRKAGAQNKTSILFFEKFEADEKLRLDDELDRNGKSPEDHSMSDAIVAAGLDYKLLLAEADHLGYLPTGVPSERNDLYRSNAAGVVFADQGDTILGEWRRFRENPDAYRGRSAPDCMGISFSTLWNAHSSHRIDPKYHLFKENARLRVPDHWVRVQIREVMEYRADKQDFSSAPDKLFRVMTIGQTGEIRDREPGKGNNPPAWQGGYLEETEGDWFAASAGDVVYSSIDLWKGCIAVVPQEFDGALVSKEFPIYSVTHADLSAEFLQTLLRSRYFRRAFRAITTGHSNRRRTQGGDFLDLEIAFPEGKQEQIALIEGLRKARRLEDQAREARRQEEKRFDDRIDARRAEEPADLLDEEPLDEETSDT